MLITSTGGILKGGVLSLMVVGRGMAKFIQVDVGDVSMTPLSKNCVIVSRDL